MTTKELQKRNEKSQDLKVLRVNGNYFVESAEGMVLYKICPTGEADKYACTCGDYARGIKGDTNFQCKHIMAVLSCVITATRAMSLYYQPHSDLPLCSTPKASSLLSFSTFSEPPGFLIKKSAEHKKPHLFSEMGYYPNLPTIQPPDYPRGNG